MSKPGETSRPRKLATPKEIADRDRRIALAVKEGVKLDDVRRRFGVSIRAARRVCAEMGVAPRGYWP